MRKQTYKNWIAAIACLACVVFAVCFKIVVVDGQSMEPTLRSHQLVIAAKNYNKIAIGDIVVFHQNGETYIKRVYATSGDAVHLKQSKVFINDAVMNSYTCDSSIDKEYLLGEEQLFVLGDNADASIDSRDFGPISVNDIIGKVVLH